MQIKTAYQNTNLKEEGMILLVSQSVGWLVGRSVS